MTASSKGKPLNKNELIRWARLMFDESMSLCGSFGPAMLFHREQRELISRALLRALRSLPAEELKAAAARCGATAERIAEIDEEIFEAEREVLR